MLEVALEVEASSSESDVSSLLELNASVVSSDGDEVEELLVELLL